MSLVSDIRQNWSHVAVPAFNCSAAVRTDAMLFRPATLAVDVAGTGYADGAATMVLADGNTIGVTLTTNAGAITALAWASGYSTSASDVAVVAVTQAGGSAGTAHVATYHTDASTSPSFIDFGEIIDLNSDYSLSAKSVTEHDTAPGATKTFTVNKYWSDEKLSMTGVATVLAGRKVAGTAKTLTNAIDTTQYFEVSAAAKPAARYLYLSVDWTALTANSSFTLEIRLNRV